MTYNDESFPQFITWRRRKDPRKLDVSEIFFSSNFFTPVRKSMPNGLGNNLPRAIINRLYSYFAPNDYILVLAALTRADGRKSTKMRKITTEPIQVKLLQIVPIRCPKPQPSGVKNRSHQPNFFGIPILHTAISSTC